MIRVYYFWWQSLFLISLDFLVVPIIFIIKFWVCVYAQWMIRRWGLKIFLTCWRYTFYILLILRYRHFLGRLLPSFGIDRFLLIQLQPLQSLYIVVPCSVNCKLVIFGKHVYWINITRMQIYILRIALLSFLVLVIKILVIFIVIILFIILVWLVVYNFYDLIVAWVQGFTQVYYCVLFLFEIFLFLFQSCHPISIQIHLLYL